MAGDLNAKQLAFVTEFLKCHEATSAARSAGYSAKSAQVIGCQLLKHPKVAAEIARRRAPIAKRNELTAERVIAELSNLAFLDPASMFDESGNLLSINEMPEATRRAIAGLDIDVGPKGNKSTKVKLSSKLGSLELAAKLLGMVKDQQVQQAAVTIVIGQPPELPAVTLEQRQLLPEWE